MVKRKFKEIEQNSEKSDRRKRKQLELWKKPASKDFKPYPAPQKYWIHCLSTSKRTSEGFKKRKNGKVKQ